MNHRHVMRKLLENFTDNEIIAIQGDNYFHRALAMRYAYEGVDFVDTEGVAYFNPRFCLKREYYVEVYPKIKIGEMEINAPFRCKPDGAEYWFFIIDHNKVCSDRFYNALQDNIRFDAGNCFRSKDDAIAALKAIKSLLNGE